MNNSSIPKIFLQGLVWIVITLSSLNLIHAIYIKYGIQDDNPAEEMVEDFLIDQGLDIDLTPDSPEK